MTPSLPPEMPPASVPAPISSGYYPGLWSQDMYTLPIGLGVLGMMQQFYTESAKPLWPFAEETNTGKRNSTRHPRTALGVVGVSVGTGSILTSHFSNSSYSWSTHMRGYMHSHLATELATSFAKVTFLRRRPFFDTEAAKAAQGIGNVRKDDRFSFFSGHSSHAFAFSTYTSAMLWTYVDNPYVTVPAAAFLFAGAAFVGSSRAVDSQHHWNDVIFGATAGTAISYFVFRRVEKVNATQVAEADQKLKIPAIYPIITLDTLSRRSFGLVTRVQF